MLVLLLPGLLLGCAVEDDGRTGPGVGGLDGGGTECVDGKCDGAEQVAACHHGDICERFENCLGEGWGAGDAAWEFKFDSGLCRARRRLDSGGFEYPDDIELTDELLRSVSLLPDEFEQESRQACAVLEQARALCMGEDVPEMRDGLCHPNADVGCSRYVPVAETFEGEARASFANGTESLDPRTASYCERQSAGDCIGDGCGYPMVRPMFPPTWQCDTAEEATELQRFVTEQLGGRMIGNPSWTVGEAGSNTCRMTKALVQCVLPNLGERTNASCDVPGDKGDAFAGFDYCFDIQQVTGGGGAHKAGRAIDLNVSDNSGNLAQCDLRCQFGSSGDGCSPDPADPDEASHYLCTNIEQPTVVDLPPRFVSVMEGCGFVWGGRWGDPDGNFRAEGRHLGCDPMHFELPAD